jgi:hypothetical protein
MHRQKDFLQGVPRIVIRHAEPAEAAKNEVRMQLVDAFQVHAWGWLFRGPSE